MFYSSLLNISGYYDQSIIILDIDESTGKTGMEILDKMGATSTLADHQEAT